MSLMSVKLDGYEVVCVRRGEAAVSVKNVGELKRGNGGVLARLLDLNT